MIFVVTGPESSGKTTLSLELSKHLGWPQFPELAREYFSARQAAEVYRYQPSDLLNLLELQQQLEVSLPPDKPCILDTDALTLLIWWQEKYGPAPLSFQRAWAKQIPRYYLLCEPDLPWEPDDMRENPLDRPRLMGWYRQELAQRNCDFSICSGLGPSRLQSALASIKQVENRLSAEL